MPRPKPANKLTDEERKAVASMCDQAVYRSSPAAFIVTCQLDQVCYLASGSILYRVLRKYDQVHPGAF